MSGTPFVPPRFIPVSSTGRPYPGALLTFYRAGTTTLATVYTDSALNVPSANPLTANSAGMFAAVYLDGASTYDYKAVLTNSSGSQLWSEDNIPADGGSVSASEVGLAIYPRTAAEIAEGVTPSAYQYPEGNVLRYGADPTATTNCETAIQTAIDVVFAKTFGGVVFFPAGQYRIGAEIVLPKSYSKAIRLVGEGPRTSYIYSVSNITAGSPVIRWDTSASGSVQLFGIEGLGIARLNGGPLIQFRQNSGATGSAGDRIAVRIIDCLLRQSTSVGQGACLDIEYSLKSYVERLWLEGGNPSGVGIQWTNCSQDYFCEIYQNGKSTVGDFFFIDGGGDHTLVATRSEGCAGNYFYKLKDCSHVTLLSPWMESDLAQDSILLDGAWYCTILNVSLGDQVGATNPNGIRFASTNRGCIGNVVTGGKTTSYDALGTGKVVVFDASASANIVQNVVVDGVATVDGEVSDAGNDNFCSLIIGAGTPPTVRTFASSPLMAGGVRSRGHAPTFGSTDNYTVDFVQNNVARLTLSSAALTFASGVGARAVDSLGIVDGITAPSTVAGQAVIYVDTADGDLKVKFGDGTVKTISTDT